MSTPKIVDRIGIDPKDEQILREGMSDILARHNQMVAQGVINENGQLLVKNLPDDMKESSRTEV